MQLKLSFHPMQRNEHSATNAMRTPQRTQRMQRTTRHRFYPCVLAVASLASATCVAYFCCVALRCVRWM